MVGEVAPHQQQLQICYKLVPWLNWDEWNFVRESLFSSSLQSIAAALRRISAWRARGRLPVAIEVTAAFVEIKQKDPFFRDGLANDTLISDEMLAMLYCMAIMRLVNGFVDKSRTESKGSINQKASSIGIPRVLVDIRHEGSHRDLPSLPLVRSASLKALDWLKSNYWEPQSNLIPNVREETKSRMREMVLSLNAGKIQRLNSSKTKRKCVKHSKLFCGHKILFSHVAKVLRSKSGGLPSKGFKKPKSILGRLIRLYSVFPSEVVAVLLEEFLRKTSDPLDSIEAVKCSTDSQVETNPRDSKPNVCTVDVWKAIITRLSSKEPALLLTMLEEVLVMIETREAMRFELGKPHVPLLQYRAQIRQIEHLSSLVPWILRNIKEAKDSGYTESTNGNNSDAITDALLSQLLRKCLQLLTPGSTNLLDSALLLAKIMGNKSITARLKKLLLLQNSPNPDQTIENSTDDLERVLKQEEYSINQAAKKLEFLKSRRTNSKTVITEAINGGMEGKAWTVAKSWSKCPIGMLPRAFGSSGVLPVLERVDAQQRENEKPGENEDYSERNKCSDKRKASCDVESLENLSAAKKMRETQMDSSGFGDCQYESLGAPVEGRLMIGGVWKKVEEEELVAIESGVRILV